MKRSDITDEQVVAACVRWRSNPTGGFVTDVLVELTGAPCKVAEAAMGRASVRGFIDYGVSLRTAWATPAGEQLLVSSRG